MAEAINNILVKRYFQNKDACISKIYLNNKQVCVGLENPVRPQQKIAGITAIPAGTYELKLRRFGGFHKKYSKLFKQYHKGMLEITKVPNFTDVLIHIGNFPKDTDGCLLIGEYAVLDKNTPAIYDSKNSYFYFYQKIMPLVESGQVLITFKNEFTQTEQKVA